MNFNHSLQRLRSYEVIEHPENLSDHLPVMISVDLFLKSGDTESKSDKTQQVIDKISYLDWRKGDTQIYYNNTGVFIHRYTTKLRILDKK